MPVEFKPDMWIERFRSVHGDRYEYGAFEKVNKNMMVTITCSEHGEFKKQLSNHWSAKAGCPTCSKANLAPQSNHLSRDQWIVRFKEAHGDRYDYSKFAPMGSRGTATFVCLEHGVFKQDQFEHSQGRVGCASCRKSDAAAKFFREAAERFEGRYCYDRFEYVSAKTKSVIICPEHGEFMQNPDKHLHSKHPCPECNSIVKNEHVLSLSKIPNRQGDVSSEEFLERLTLDDRHTVDVDGYINLSQGTVTLTCREHGSSTLVPEFVLAAKHKCLKCAPEAYLHKRHVRYERFISGSSEVHDNAYRYDLVALDYVEQKSLVRIICNKHGEFRKRARNHLSGQGCPLCRMDQLVMEGKVPGGYNLASFAANAALGSTPGLVYYLKVGQLYKIGITAMDVGARMAAIRSDSKMEVSLIQTHSCPLKEAYMMEQSILQQHRELRVRRRWSTELFSTDVLRGKNISDVQPYTEVEIASW